MATAAVLPALVSVEEYLRTSYDPDVDYVDGYLDDRHVGENSHSDLQSELVAILRTMGRGCGVYAFVEHRLQVNSTRYRVPDVLLMPRSWKKVPIIYDAPMLCIEVLSSEDTFSRTMVKCRDYLDMGVPEVWMFDPDEHIAFVITQQGTSEYRAGALKLAGTQVEVSLDDLFAAVDEGR